jgi:hypothetical protein
MQDLQKTYFYSVGLYELALLRKYLLSWLGLRHGLHFKEKQISLSPSENPTTISRLYSRSPIHYTDYARKRQLKVRICRLTSLTGAMKP